jgi:hypothetical protein
MVLAMKKSGFVQDIFIVAIRLERSFLINDPPKSEKTFCLKFIRPRNVFNSELSAAES